MANKLRKTKNCRRTIQKRAKQVKRIKDGKSPDKWIRPLRWYDVHLDMLGVDNVEDLTSAQAEKTGFVVSEVYNGTTQGFVWRRINDLYEWLEKRGDIDDNPYEEWDMEEVAIDNDTAQSDYDPITLSQSQVKKLEKNVGAPRHRNQCIVRMMYQSGLRRGEVSSLIYFEGEEDYDKKTRDELIEDDDEEVGDIDFARREIRVRDEVAKNSLPRKTIYQSTLDGLIDEWLLERETIDPDHDEFFCGVRGGRLSGDAINKMIVKAAKKAGMGEVMYVDGNGGLRWSVRSHSIRKGFGTFMANDTECDIFKLSKLLGHQSVDLTVEKYVEHDDEAGLDHGHIFGPK